VYYIRVCKSVLKETFNRYVKVPLRYDIAIIFSVDRDFDWDKLNVNQIGSNSNRFKPPNSAIYKVTVAMTG